MGTRNDGQAETSRAKPFPWTGVAGAMGVVGFFLLYGAGYFTSSWQLLTVAVYGGGSLVAAGIVLYFVKRT